MLFGFPEEYYQDLPPEVDPDYMARANEIRTNAQASLAQYRADPDYQYLCSRIDTLAPKDIEKTSIRSVVNYATGLEQAIMEDRHIGFWECLLVFCRHIGVFLFLDATLYICDDLVQRVLRDIDEVAAHRVHLRSFYGSMAGTKKHIKGSRLR